MIEGDVRRAHRVLIGQVIATVIVTLIGLIFGIWTGLSALFGGTAATLGNALFALLVFGPYRAQEPGSLVYRFYGAELLKLLLVALVFWAVFIWFKPVSVVALFGSFLAVQMLPTMLAHRFGAQPTTRI
mgnify:CR=1 FL=1